MYPPELPEEILALDQQLQAGVDVIYLGDSTLIHPVGEPTLPEILSELVPNRMFGDVAHPAYQLDLYERYVNYLVNYPSQVETVIVPINMRSFSPEWDLRPTYQFEREKAVLTFGPWLSTIFYRPFDTFGLFDSPISQEDFLEATVFNGDQAAGKVAEFEELTGASGTEAEETGSTDFAYHAGIPSEDETEALKATLVYYYMYELDPNHRKIQSLLALNQLLKENGIAPLFYITPINYELGERHLGETFRQRLVENTAVVEQVLHENGVDVLNLVFDLAAYNFVDTEHLTENGKYSVAEALAEVIEPPPPERLTSTAIDDAPTLHFSAIEQTTPAGQEPSPTPTLTAVITTPQPLTAALTSSPAAGAKSRPSLARTPTPSTAPDPTVTPIPTATYTVTPTSSPAPTIAPTFTPTAVPTSTETPTLTPEPAPTATPQPLAAALTSTSMPTPTSRPTRAALTSTPAPGPTVTRTPMATLQPTATPTSPPTPTIAPTFTPTAVPTSTLTPLPTATQAPPPASPTPQPTATATPEAPPAPEAGQLISVEFRATFEPAGNYKIDLYRLRYKSIDWNEQLTEVQANIYVPQVSDPVEFPILIYAPGTTGLSDKCAPLNEVPTGSNWGAYHSYMLEYTAQGLIGVLPNYQGFDVADQVHPYFISEFQGRALLDAGRAAYNFFGQSPEVTARPMEAVFTAGYSSGGHAAFAAKDFVDSYAPELPLKGVIGHGPTTNPATLLLEAAIFSPYIVQGYRDFYGPEIVDPAGVFQDRWLTNFEADVMARCVDGLFSYYGFSGRQMYRPEFLEALRAGRLQNLAPAFKDALDSNAAGLSPDGAGVAVLILQGTADQIVLPPTQTQYATDLCQLGNQVTYITYPAVDHPNIRRASFRDTISWIQNVAGGNLPESSCASLSQ